MEQELKKRSIHRINIIAGQVEGLKKMIDEETYCLDILQLSDSIQNSLRSLNALLLENHLKTHIAEQISKGEVEKAVKELLAVYKFAEPNSHEGKH